jgi:hypothetical protein
MRPNFERLRDAFAIIDGIPKKAFDLDMWVSQRGKNKSCGTIACAAGWLAMHPKMNGFGLTNSMGGAPEFKGLTSFAALREFFHLNYREGDLFEAAGSGYADNELPKHVRVALSDKQLWKRRVLRLFQAYNEPFDPKVGEGLLLDVRGA